MFHHRLSTSTADVPNACHPFSTKNLFENNYVGVHNGVVYNDNELEKEHQALGIEYVSRQPNGQFNDSEALIIDIARYLEGETKEITAEGTIAFIIVKRNADGKPTTLFFGRNTGNPLKMKKTKHSMTISSEGEGEEVKPNTLYSYDYDTGTMTERYMYIPSYRSFSSQSSGYYDYRGYNEGYVDTRTGRGLYEDMDLRTNYDDGDTDYLGTDRDYLNEYKEARNIIDNSDFIPRKGTEAQIKGQIMTEVSGDFENGAIQALVEAEEAEREEKRINDALYTPVAEGAWQDLSDYWYFCNSYKKMLMEISEYFEGVANNMKNRQTVIQEIKEGEGVKQADGSIVFPSGITVAPEEQSLLPLAAGLS